MTVILPAVHAAPCVRSTTGPSCHDDAKHITLDGHELLLAEDGIFIDGLESPNEITRVQITLIAPKATIDSEVE